MLCSDHRTKFVMLFVLRIRSLFIRIPILFINISATSAMMFTSARQNITYLSRQYEYLGRPILTEKPLRYNEKDTVRKHCHQQHHPADSFLLFLD